MKLENRFNHQAEQKPTDLQKMRIYQQFLDKSHRSISFHKISYYTKVAVFSIGLFLLGWTIYYSGQPLWTTPYELTQKDWYATLQELPWQFVQADTIWQIISAEWSIEINHNNTQIETEMLSSNDRVLLAEGAEMHFRIDDHIHAKISGPAEFVLEDTGSQEGIKTYAINLISWDYLEIVTIPQEKTKEKSEIKPVAQVTVKAADFTIEQVDTLGSMDLVISTAVDGTKQVKNNGTEIVMKKIVAQKQTYVAIQQDETVSVNGRVEFVVDDQTPQEVLAQLEDTKFTVRYEVKDIEDATVSDVLRTSETLAKKVASEALITYLNVSLSSSALQRYVDEMNMHATQWDIEWFRIAYNNYLQKIARGFELWGITYVLPSAEPETLPIAIALTQNLATELAAVWYIDPSLFQGLRSTAVSLSSISHSFVDEDSSGSEDEIATDTTVETVELESSIEIETQEIIESVETEEAIDPVDIWWDQEDKALLQDTLEEALQWVSDPTKPIE